jgi:hypothetical protein
MKIIRFALIGLCTAAAGCGFFDSRIECRDGPYILIWIDIPSSTTLNYALEGGTSVGRIDETVFSVGRNERCIVAKQHPRDDKSVTNYFFIDKDKDKPYADPRDFVVGPLSEMEFHAKAKELGLPEFRKTLTSLQ